MKMLKKKPFIIAAVVLVALIVLSNALSKKPPLSAAKDSPAPTQSAAPDNTSPPPNISTDNDVEPVTQPPIVEEETPYLELSKDENAYLLFLRIIGTCYKDNSLTQEMFDEMAQYDGVQPLVEDALNYRYQQGVLSPDFVASFSAFWTDDVASAHAEVIDALKVSFDLEYNLAEKVWVLKENEDTIAAHTEDVFEWLPATGHLFPGVELYIVTDDTTTLYGVVTELDTKGTQVQIYLSASDEIQWFERRTDWFSDVLKVRSDDPRLPQY